VYPGKGGDHSFNVPKSSGLTSREAYKKIAKKACDGYALCLFERRRRIKPNPPLFTSEISCYSRRQKIKGGFTCLPIMMFCWTLTTKSPL
jgi:hypothetical protein